MERWLRRLLLTLGVVMSALTAFSFSADASCVKTSEWCAEGGGTRTIDGFPVYKDCWRYDATMRCGSGTYLDYCAPLRNTGRCTAVNSTCVAWDPDGICGRYQDEYVCDVQLGSLPSNVVFLNTTYTISNDSISNQCTSLEQNSSCELAGEVCVEGGGTRNINGLDVYKDCWKWRRDYTCRAASTKNDCAKNEQEGCTFLNEECIATDRSGTCRTWQRNYRCGEASSQGPKQVVCGDSIYCIDGDCESISYEPNKDFTKAVTYLNLLRDMGKDFDPNSLRVFSGKNYYCGKGIIGFSNCCSDDGWGLDLGIAQCSDDEKMLAEKLNAKLCTYVGTYCGNKILGVCLSKRKSYCCFQSRLARMLQEQGRPQIHKEWGDPKSPNCTGFTLEEMQSIDFSQVDLTEFYPQLLKQIDVPGEAKIKDEFTSRIENYYARR